VRVSKRVAVHLRNTNAEVKWRSVPASLVFITMFSCESVVILLWWL